MQRHISTTLPAKALILEFSTEITEKNQATKRVVHRFLWRLSRYSVPNHAADGHRLVSPIPFHRNRASPSRRELLKGGCLFSRQASPQRFHRFGAVNRFRIAKRNRLRVRGLACQGAIRTEGASTMINDPFEKLCPACKGTGGKVAHDNIAGAMPDYGPDPICPVCKQAV
jgi:hypothetical protein